MIKNIFLDLDDTLLDFHRAEKQALKTALDALGLPSHEAVLSRYSRINDGMWKLLEQGRMTREEVRVERFRQLFAELGVRFEADAAARAYEERLARGHFFMEGAEALLQTLFGRYRLYLASNGTAVVQHGRLESAGIQPYFQDIFISEELGAYKPSPLFFERCFSRIPDFRSEESVIIGDGLTSDIRGGLDAGLTTIWLQNPDRQPSGLIRPHYTVHSLGEIPALLETLG